MAQGTGRKMIVQVTGIGPEYISKTREGKDGKQYGGNATRNINGWVTGADGTMYKLVGYLVKPRPNEGPGRTEQRYEELFG